MKVEHTDEQHRSISYMHEDLISNLSLQLPSITKLCFLLRSQYDDDYRVFRRFLHLLPNLVYLQMYIGRTLFREMLSGEDNENFVSNALKRISVFQMVRFYDENNILNDEEIHDLFPNAQILFDYK